MKANKSIAVVILLVGLALIVAPFIYQMFDRAPAGADMMEDFEPVLTRENVTRFQGHMETFGGIQTDMEAMMPALAQQLGMTQDQLNEWLGQQFPALAEGMQQMDIMGEDFNTVITVMDNNVENFQKANELPMRTMPWFFVVAGVILVILSGAQLLLPSRT